MLLPSIYPHLLFTNIYLLRRLKGAKSGDFLEALRGPTLASANGLER